MREPAHRLGAAGLLLLVLACGCHHESIRRRSLEDSPLPRLTSAELFEIALFQARRGDYLRAEQYLSAARQGGYSEPSVVYWLVRVCIAAGRYHSALLHASAYLRDHPSNWRLRLVVASIHEALGDLSSAQLELESIVDTEPNRALPHYRLAMLYRRLPESAERAVPHLRAYLALRPNGTHAAEVRGALNRAPAGARPSSDVEALQVLSGVTR
jgi:tetratricopeptide (TPR) repeat protein